MMPQLPPNASTCLPVAFACCLDIDVVDIFEYLGHDGSEILWPDLESPFCFQPFHIQELIEYTFVKHHRRVLYLERTPIGFVDEMHVQRFDSRILDDLVNGNYGVLINFENNHAVAWDGENCYDGLTVKPGLPFEVQSFCLF